MVPERILKPHLVRGVGQRRENNYNPLYFSLLEMSFRMPALYTYGIRLSPRSNYRHPRGTSLIKDQISPAPSSKSDETCRYLHSSFNLRSESGDPRISTCAGWQSSEG